MKILVIKKFIVAISLAIVIFFSAFWLNVGGVVDVCMAYAGTLKKLPIYSVDTEYNKLSISL